MKKYDIVRREIVSVERNDAGVFICVDTGKPCITSGVALAFKSKPKKAICRHYELTDSEYDQILSQLPSDVEPVISSDINYKTLADTNILTTSVMELQLSPEEEKRLKQLQHKNGWLI